MKETKITILIVNYKSSDFIKINLEALGRLSCYPHNILICDNFSSQKEKNHLIKICKKYDNIKLIFRKQTRGGSIGHGEALDILISKVDTPYFVILDADAILLKKNWDKIVIDRMKGDVKIIGTQPPTSQNKKPIDFPLMFAVIIATRAFRNLNIKMCPRSLEEAIQGKDTGYQMRGRFMKSNYKWELIYFKSTRYFKEGPFRDVICAEYYLSGIDHIFASHFGRGSTLGANKYKNSNKKYFYKIPFLGDIFLKNKGKQEKENWINICKQIVDEQTNGKTKI